MRAPSVEIRSVPDGVTCCQRMSPLILSVQVGVERLDAGVPAARAEAGARICAPAAVLATARMRRDTIVRADRAAMDDSVGTSVGGWDLPVREAGAVPDKSDGFSPGTTRRVPPGRAKHASPLHLGPKSG